MNCVEQFRICRLQVFNWGTFSGLHDIPISERGFLFVGRSGSGKSTLLDAFSALLTPPRWTDFNAAAREMASSGRDRNLITYVRGAFAEQKSENSGEIAACYLRPGTTWTALALSYQNKLNQHVTLVQIFWLRGNGNNNADLRRHYFIFERPFDLKEMEVFGKSNFDFRALKANFPEAFARDEFRSYCERFCRLLGIENEMALRLLHKTQSAKNLGDLNTFLRDFMLDKPETFAVAERLVSEFVELNAAHQTVVTAREQVHTLIPARDQHQQMQILQQQQSVLSELRLGVDAYRETQRICLLEQQISILMVRAQGLTDEMHQQQHLFNNAIMFLRDLEQQHRDMGGDWIERWETEIAALNIQQGERLRKRGQIEIACHKLGWTMADSPQHFAEQVNEARQEIDQWEKRAHEAIDARVQLVSEKKQVETQFTETVKEIQALKKQPSNIPADMLELRQEIAQAIQVAESALPFVGELLDIKSEEAAWKGAAERTLRGFALSLLVDERYYTALAQYLNQTYLGKRLVYYRTVQAQTWQPKPLANHSLVLKLNVKEGSHTQWLQNELRQRFDYSCVDSMQAFKAADKALTVQGQIKHSKTRHEKDDRINVNDRRHWVLGFDNREKLTVFETQAQKLAERIAQLEQAINTLIEQDKQRSGRMAHCQTLINIEWQETDVAALLDRIGVLEKQVLAAKKENTALQQLGKKIEEQKNKVTELETLLREKTIAHARCLEEIEKTREKLNHLSQDPTLITLTPFQAQGLAERFAELAIPLHLNNLDSLTTTVERSLTQSIENLNRQMGSCEKKIEHCFAEFKRRWAMEASDMDTSVASAPDYFAKLVRLETDGLPAYEERFFELLQNQSHQNLAALSTYLNDARKMILERMNVVNDSLSQVPFNQSLNQRTYLRIDPSDRQLPEVREFKQDIQQALSHAWNKDPALAESRFLALRKLVERLSSQDANEKRWRDCVLDVRQHVEFIGREIDEAGIEIEVYRSGAGKSGGQRQKLATTCLAAALRYQLGGQNDTAPMYAPVILDEAFDKADNEFTTLAMNIFANFGFQMIVATPLKSVMTLEPFIGGACFVEISDRRVSSIFLIEYNAEDQRLKLPTSLHEGIALETS